MRVSPSLWRNTQLMLWPMMLLTLAGCANWPKRPNITAAQQQSAEVEGYADIRRWADAPSADWVRWNAARRTNLQHAGQAVADRVLMISSGSDKGAYSAGYLVGWSASGKRPRFSIVTGVSTGALIAPLAFLGSDYDSALKALYTGISAKNIYRRRQPIAGLLGAPGLADTKPLAALIARYMTSDIVDKIAVQHRLGRRLLVLTTNLDAGRGMVWDIGAICASAAPNRIALVRNILLASASIPAIFPPVLIDVRGRQGVFNEMHVDGGTISGLLAVPASVLWDGTAESTRGVVEIDALYNGRRNLEYRVIKPHTFPIIGRAFDTALVEADRRALNDYQTLVEVHGGRLRVSAIDPDFTFKGNGLFDRNFMNVLYQYGYDRGLKPF